MRIFEKGVGNVVRWLVKLDSDWLYRQQWHGYRGHRRRLRRRCRMVGTMRSGFPGIIVVDRTVIAMMMARGFQMLNFVGDVESVPSRQQTGLHGKTMQGQQHQQDNKKETTHVNDLEKAGGDYSKYGRASRRTATITGKSLTKRLYCVGFQYCRTVWDDSSSS